MKVLAFRQNRIKTIQNINKQTSPNLPMSNPIKFKGNDDSFEPQDVNEISFNTEEKKPASTIDFKIVNEGGFKKIRNTKPNKENTLEMKCTVYNDSGVYNGNHFTIKKDYIFLGPVKKYSGKINSKILNLDVTYYGENNENIRMKGTLKDPSEDKPKYIYLRGIDKPGISALKGYINQNQPDQEKFELTFSKGQFTGSINDKNFTFTNDNTKITGETEYTGELFPMIIILANNMIKHNNFVSQEYCDGDFNSHVGG